MDEIVMIPFPAQGHINPMVHLAHKLADLDLGIRITLVVPQTLLDAVTGCLDRASISVVGIAKGAIEASQWRANVNGFFAMMNAAAEMEAPLEEMLKGKIERGERGICCLIGDSSLALVQDVANRLGIPRVALWTSGASAALPNVLVKELRELGLLPVKDAMAARGNAHVQGVPGMGKYRLRDLPFGLWQDEQVIAMRIAITGRTREAAAVLFNTLDAVEGEYVELFRRIVPHAYPVGPLLPPIGSKKKGSGGAAWKEDRECLRWLDARAAASVVYVSFGSLANLSARQIEELAMALDASGAPFLWVLRPNLCGDDGGSTKFLEEFTQRTRERGRTIPWSPQVEVLSHPSTALFVSHCGWNSISEALCCGVPLVAWPCFSEQNSNARFVVEERRLGVVLPSAMESSGAFVERNEISDAIRRALGDEEIARNVKAVSEQAKAAAASKTQLQAFASAFIKCK